MKCRRKRAQTTYGRASGAAGHSETMLDAWVRRTARRLGLESTLRVGKPKSIACGKGDGSADVICGWQGVPLQSLPLGPF